MLGKCRVFPEESKPNCRVNKQGFIGFLFERVGVNSKLTGDVSVAIFSKENER
jgi:hypothetical protein